MLPYTKKQLLLFIPFFFPFRINRLYVYGNYLPMDTTLNRFLQIRRAGHSQVKSQKQAHVPAIETNDTDRSAGEGKLKKLWNLFSVECSTSVVHLYR